MTISDDLYATRLTINLDAIAQNYRQLQAMLDPAGTQAGAAVKANGYGLGARPVVRALWQAGCRNFFVAHPHEGVVVREELPDARIHILNGPLPDAIDDYLHFGLIPVLNSLGDIALWRNAAQKRGVALAANVHLDTGMCRLGLDLGETEAFLSNAEHFLQGIDLQLCMSHLASADDPESDQSARQLKLFQSAFKRLGRGLGSFSNSSGIFLGADYHFDIARPGVALYGGNPTPYRENPMQNPVSLYARILQVRNVDVPETVGYGATHVVNGPRRIATVPVGYADGFLRQGSDVGMAYIGDFPAPIAGRVSMDLITLDVTDVPEHLARPGAMAEFLGPHQTADDLARDWQTIPYEVLTGLGQRYARVYEGTGA